MPNYLSKKSQSITPYTAGAQPSVKNIIKLNTNENPYPPSPATLAALAGFDGTLMRLYPRPDGGELRQTIARAYNLDARNVFCGNGSDEVLAFAYEAFFDSDIMFPDITYSFYTVWADLFDISYTLLPVNDDFTVPIENLKANGIVLANPNAPTGIALNLPDIERVLNQNKDYVVIVDEAYAAFGATSAAPLVSSYPNLLIVNTLSKSHCLAGLRVGYALGQQHLIDAMMRIKDSFNSYPVDSLAQKIASAAISDTQYYQSIAQKIIATRERVSQKLTSLGFSVLPSCANFLFASHSALAAKDIKAHLETHGIFVRHFDLPRISNHLRITIGTDEQMDMLLSKVSELVSK